MGLLGPITAVWGAKFSGGLAGTIGFQAGTQLLSDTIGGTNCLSSPNTVGGIGTNQSSCTTYPLSSTIGSSSTTTLGNQGSVAPTQATVATGGACGVQELVDTSTTGTNTGLAFGGLTYGATGPGAFTDAPTSITLDGSTGWGETLTSLAGQANYTLMAWIKPSARNGVLIGDTNVQSTTAPTNTDRMVWIDSSGRLNFGNNTTTLRATAASALTTGTWYFVVVTKSTGSGMAIYVNGALNNSSASAGAESTLSYNGYWHLGWGSAVGSGFSNLPTTNYFAGSMADVAVFPSALSAAAVTTLYGKTTQAAFSTQVLADAPTSYWPLQDTGSALYTGAIANLPANAAATTYRDASNNPGTNVGTGQGTLGVDASGPIGDSATTFDGSTGWIQTATGPPTAFYASPGPQTFSLAGWFKTTSSGSILGFTTLQGNGTPTMWDRHMWVDPSGHVVFGVYPNGYFEVNSSATTAKNYADGNWHFVVATVAPVSATVGTVLLYVDGALVAGSAGDETITGSDPAQVYGGWWHLGWSNATSTWPDPPTSAYWGGSLGQMAVFPSALSGANVSSLYGAPTASAYLAAVTGGVGASNAFWPLDEKAPPGSPACSYIAMTIQAAATCVYPLEVGACPAVPPSNWLSVSVGISLTLPTLTFTTAVSGSVPATGTGIHVSVPWVISDGASGFSSRLTHTLGYVAL
ncbi:MAG TPA: LamG domain-containing protein [Acidimicrobiales bacterium]|nr:LamG domain-containing protein [Acidimicrobiales bacterium]